VRLSMARHASSGGSLVDLLECCAWFVYLSRGTSRLAEESRALVLRLKQEGGAEGGGELLARQIVQEHAEELGTRFGDFFGPQVTMVPVPRSRRLTVREAWPSRGIALGLVEAGLAGGVAFALERARPVWRSSWVDARFRVSPSEHASSLAVVRTGVDLRTVTLVDDVVTRGSQLLGAASALRRVYPHVTVRAFALARTIGYRDAKVESGFGYRGVIRLLWQGDDAVREP